ncbi:hypothetical protein PLEOSDRAFT_157954 [Pleurotus ostreatus PC15]|uniref:Uncharacterized protein n=1 Tax=Pleurotus ostreatus (strain PC15) TaxID=1137138 RepID=A0A067NVM3_PLEO1|nr:hypothetical protein PLEOSDRAFT_157954 [Pleurotus ostreatus PC15]
MVIWPKASYEILKGNDDEGPFGYYGSRVSSSPPQHDNGSNRDRRYDLAHAREIFQSSNISTILIITDIGTVQTFLRS